MLSVAGEFVAIGRVVVEHQQWIAGLRRQRPKEHMHLGCSARKRRTCANEMQPAHRTELKAAVGAALGDGGLYPARLAMGGGAGYGTALDALRDGPGRCTRRRA